MDQFAAVRRSYDLVADAYADVLRDHLGQQPVDRAMLGIFAEGVLAEGVLAEPGGPVVELGCGPGRIAAHLAALGLPMAALDLSAEMLRVTRRDHPALPVAQATLAALPFGSGRLAGAVAWYSIIHVPPPQLPEVFAEFARVLRPGAPLLLAFQVGDGQERRVTHAYGQDLDVSVYRLPVDLIEQLAAAAGFDLQLSTVRAPAGDEAQPQAYLLFARSA